MSAKRNKFQALYERAREGFAEAAAEIVRLFGGRVRQVVRRHLDRRVRPLFDSTDLTQEVWSDFFAKVLYAQNFANAKRLGGYLAKMAEHKARDAGRSHLQTQKGDLRRERELSALPRLAEQLADPRPGPAQIAEDHDEWEHTLYKYVEYRDVIELLGQGYNCQQIAAELGVSVKSVRRAIRKLYPRK